MRLHSPNSPQKLHVLFAGRRATGDHEVKRVFLDEREGLLVVAAMMKGPAFGSKNHRQSGFHFLIFADQER